MLYFLNEVFIFNCFKEITGSPTSTPDFADFSKQYCICIQVLLELSISQPNFSGIIKTYMKWKCGVICVIVSIVTKITLSINKFCSFRYDKETATHEISMKWLSNQDL